DLMAAVVAAANQPGVSVVSMSWGHTERQVVSAQQEALYDTYLTTPAGHQGVTFVASSGDYGTANPEYPAFSPNVVAVGGTSVSAPVWAGLFALANQGRVAAGSATLNSAGPAEAQHALYSAPVSAFHQVSTGGNGTYTAGAGYNLVTGLGTPVANVLLPN